MIMFHLCNCISCGRSKRQQSSIISMTPKTNVWCKNYRVRLRYSDLHNEKTIQTNEWCVLGNDIANSRNIDLDGPRHESCLPSGTLLLISSAASPFCQSILNAGRNSGSLDDLLGQWERSVRQTEISFNPNWFRSKHDILEMHAWREKKCRHLHLYRWHAWRIGESPHSMFCLPIRYIYIRQAASTQHDSTSLRQHPTASNENNNDDDEEWRERESKKKTIEIEKLSL